MSTCSLYNESELNHYGMCRTYKLSKDKSVMLTQYVTKEKLRAERAEARVKELDIQLSEANNLLGLALATFNASQGNSKIIISEWLKENDK